MKKFTFITFLLMIIFCFTSISCAKHNSLSPYVSDVREDIFVGENKDFSLKAYLGKREEPFIKDGTVGLIKPRLFVKITNNFNTNTEVKGVITFNKISYTEVFKFDPLTNNLSANFNIENFSDKTFDITLFYLDTSSTITLNSIKPTNALSVNDALNFLQKNQPTLIDGYFDENKNFNAELFVRLIVEKEKPYYYIGIATSKKVVAFLLDGYTGEVLSIKEVF